MPAGTITLTNNSTAVTGSGTAFPTELKANDFLVAVVGGTTYTLGVKSVESATALILTTAYGGPTTGGLAWTPIPNGTLVGITAQIAADTARAIRGLNYDKQNWQQVYSGTDDITVTLPDGSTYTGPSLPKMLRLISHVNNGWDSPQNVKTFHDATFDLNDVDFPGVVAAYRLCKNTPRTTKGTDVYNGIIDGATDCWWLVETTVHNDPNFRVQRATSFTGPDYQPYGLYTGRTFVRVRTFSGTGSYDWQPWNEDQRTGFGAQFPSLEMSRGGNYIDFHNTTVDATYPDYSIRAVCNYETGRAFMTFMGGGIPAVIDAYGGYRCRAGMGAGGADNTYNFTWETPGNLVVYIDTTRVGQVQMITSGERMKDIQSRERDGAQALERINAAAESALLTYSWKPDGVFSDEQPARLGFSAQRLKAISEYYASGTGEGDDPNENQMNVEMLAIMSDQCAAIAELKAQIDELKVQLNPVA